MVRTDMNGKLDGNGLKRGDFTEGAVTILAPLVVGKVSSPMKLNTLESLGALPEVKIPTPPKITKIKVGQIELPTTTKESVDSKLWTYLLDSKHPQGGPKAKWFKEALGFTKENMQDLSKQIIFDPTKAIKTSETPFGIKYNQVINVKGANGRNIDVLFGWIENEDKVLRLTTAIPAKK
jgi:hypothetical protein